MELAEFQPKKEKTEQERREVAEQIHLAITTAIDRLLENEDMTEEHSSLVELRGEQLIAQRALALFDTEESLVRAA